MVRATKSRTGPPAERVREFIDNEIRPAVNEDGGEIEFEGISGNEVRVRMSAACATCPSRSRTVAGYIQERLRRQFGAKLTVKARFTKWYFA